LCVDYRRLNKVTIKNQHLLSLIDKTLDRLTGAKMLTKVNLKNAYYRIWIKGENVWKTAFRTCYGHFEYLVLLFRLTNALVTFQLYINRVIARLLNNFVVVYLDNILIYSKKGKDHKNYIRQVLKRLRKHKLYAKLSKYEFCVKQVKYLRFIVTAKRVKPDLARVNTVAK
jgi:hypothetical protein